MRGHYRFDYTHVSPLAVCHSVPIRDEFAFEWLRLVTERVLVGLSNRAELEGIAELRDYHNARHRLVTSLVGGGMSRIRELRQAARDALRMENRIGAPQTHAASLTDYSTLFRTIGLPGIARNFAEDAMFAEMRVAGPNPVMIRRLTAPDERIPLTETLFQIGAPGDSLVAAMAEARLYLADYSLLDGAEAGDYPNGMKYLAAPLAVFVVDKTSGRLTPVAIQCQQRPGPDNPVFTPGDGWNWMIAKTFVEIADGNRLADLVPPPRKHRHRYHGVFAPNHKLRPAVTALAIGNIGKRREAVTGGHAAGGRATGGCCDANPNQKPARTTRHGLPGPS